MSANTGVIGLARVLPLQLVGATRGRHMIERNLLVYRRSWIVLISGAMEPLFYLFAVGIGVGGLVGDLTGPGGEPISYAAFIAPALLAASAMNGSIFEMYNVFFKLRYEKLYDAALATPMQPRDIAVGEVTWSLIRSGLYSIGFLVVVTALGLVGSWWGLLVVPAALLIGFCFASATIAATTFMRSWQDFDLVTLVILPLFLFSATFYPLDVYPEAIRPLIRLSPLYHGVELVRATMLGIVDLSLLGHVGFLVAMGAVGVTISARRFSRILRA